MIDWTKPQTEEYIEKHSNKVDWNIISQYQK